MKAKRYFKQFLFLILIASCTLSAYGQTRVIAHRGYWKTEGSAQNSLTALKKAHELGIYGSEFDVWLTADGEAIVNHDDSIPGYDIQKSTYEQIRSVPLSNGEKIPSLNEYLALGKELEGIQLVLEIKPHRRIFDEDRLVRKVVEMVDKYELAYRVDYISFSMNICKELKRLRPNATVVYLNGDLNPAELVESGFSGLDYSQRKLVTLPEWIKETKDSGLSTNVWTVNAEEFMNLFIDLGVDFITTDEPLILKGLLEKR